MWTQEQRRLVHLLSMPLARNVLVAGVLSVVALTAATPARADEEQVQIEVAPAPAASPLPAQGPSDAEALAAGASPVAPSGGDAAISKELRRARKKRTAGKILTGIGSAGVVGGAAFLAYAASTNSFKGEFGGFAVLVGLVPIVVGSAALAVGIPLWVSGESTLDRLQQSAWTRIVPQVSLAPGGGALGLGGTF